MKFKTLVCSVIVVMAMLPAFAQAKTRLIVNCFWPPQHLVCSKLLPTWLEEIERVTEGRVVGNVPPKSVAPPPEQLASVEKGVVDAAVQFNGLIQNRVSGPLVAMQPFAGSEDAAAMSEALWETTTKYFPTEFDMVQLVSQWVVSPGRLFSMTDTPITTLDDFASRKIWALPGPLANMATALGAGVVSTPAVKSNEVISTGVVDGHLGLGGDAIQSFQVIPYTKSMTKFSKPMYSTSFSLVVNNDKWSEISPEDQAAIMEVSGSTFGKNAGAAWDAIGADVFAKFPELGISVHDVDPALEAKFAEAADQVTTKWIETTTGKGFEGNEALEFYKQRVKDLSQ